MDVERILAMPQSLRLCCSRLASVVCPCMLLLVSFAAVSRVRLFLWLVANSSVNSHAAPVLCCGWSVSLCSFVRCLPHCARCCVLPSAPLFPAGRAAAASATPVRSTEAPPRRRGRRVSCEKRGSRTHQRRMDVASADTTDPSRDPHSGTTAAATLQRTHCGGAPRGGQGEHRKASIEEADYSRAVVLIDARYACLRFCSPSSVCALVGGIRGRFSVCAVCLHPDCVATSEQQEAAHTQAHGTMRPDTSMRTAGTTRSSSARALLLCVLSLVALVSSVPSVSGVLCGQDMVSISFRDPNSSYVGSISGCTGDFAVSLPYPITLLQFMANFTTGPVTVDIGATTYDTLTPLVYGQAFYVYGNKWDIYDSAATEVTIWDRYITFNQLPPDIRTIGIHTFNYTSNTFNAAPVTSPVLNGPLQPYMFGQVNSPTVQFFIFGNTTVTRSDTRANITLTYLNRHELHTVVDPNTPIVITDLQLGWNYFSVNSSWDYNGVYNVSFYYSEFSQLSLQGYAGATIGTNTPVPTVDLSTTLSPGVLITDQVVAFDRVHLPCVFNVSYATTTLSANALVTASTLLRLNVTNSVYSAQSTWITSNTLSASNAVVLAVGDNVVSVDNTRGEAYYCTIHRLPSRLTSITVDGWRKSNEYYGTTWHVANGTGLESNSSVFQLPSRFQPFANGLRTYDLTVGSKWTYAGLRVMIDPTQTDVLTLSIDGVVKSTLTPGVLSAAAAPTVGVDAFALTSNATTIFTINSVHDGNYTIRIHRNLPDIKLWASAQKGAGSAFAPMTLVGGGTSAVNIAVNPTVIWRSNLTLSYSDILILASIGTASNVVQVSSFSYPTAVLSSYDGVSIPTGTLYSPQSDTFTLFEISSVEDGEYVVEVYKPFEVNSVKLLLLQSATIGAGATPTVDFTTQRLPPTVAPVDLVALDRANVDCSVNVTYGYSTLAAWGDASASAVLRLNVTNGQYGEQTLLFANGTVNGSYVTNPALLLWTGDNLVSVENTRGEVYFCMVNRAMPVVLNLTLDAWSRTNEYYTAQGAAPFRTANGTALASSSTVFQMPTTLQPFATDRRFYEITVGYRWEFASIRVNGPTGAVYTIKANGISGAITPNQADAAASPAIGITAATLISNQTNIVAIETPDGNYTFRIHRNAPDLSGLWLSVHDPPPAATGLAPLSLDTPTLSGSVLNVALTPDAASYLWRANASFPQANIKVVMQANSATNVVKVSSALAADQTLPSYAGEMPPVGTLYTLPYATSSLFFVSSLEDGDFVFQVYHVGTTLDVYAPPAGGSWPVVYCGTTTRSVTMELTDVAPPVPAVELLVQVSSFINGNETLRGGTLRLLCTLASPCNQPFTTFDTPVPTVNFLTSSAKQFFTFQAPDCAAVGAPSGYDTWVNYTLRGSGLPYFTPYDWEMAQLVSVRPQADVNITMVSNPNDPLNTGVLYAGSSWTVRVDPTEAPADGINLGVRVDIVCLPAPGSSAAVVTTGSNCGTSVQFLTNSSTWTETLQRLVLVRAPAPLVVSQLMQINVTFFDSDEFHYRPTNVSWLALPSLQIPTPTFLDASYGRVSTVTVNLPASVSASTELVFNFTAKDLGGSTVIQPQSTIVPAGTSNFTFNWTAPSYFVMLTFSFTLGGSDAPHFIAPLPSAQVRVGTVGSLGVVGMPTAVVVNGAFSVGLYLSMAPVDQFGANTTFTVSVTPTDGAVFSVSSVTFNAFNYGTVQYLRGNAPGTGRFSTLRAGRHVAHTMANFDPVNNPDPTFTWTWQHSGANPTQFSVLAAPSIRMQSAVTLTGLPTFMYVKQQLSVSLTWIGAHNVYGGDVGVAMTPVAVPTMAAGADDSAVLNLRTFDSTTGYTLVDYFFDIRAPSTLPSGLTPRLQLGWSLTGSQASRFDFVTSPIAYPTRSYFIELRPQAVITVVGRPTSMYGTTASGLITIQLSEAVNGGLGSNLVLSIGLSSSAGVGVAKTGYTDVPTVTIPAGASSGTFTYYAPAPPAGTTNTVTMTISVLGGGDVAHYAAIAAPHDVGYIDVHAQSGFYVAAPVPLSTDAYSPLTVTFHPLSPPLPNTVVAVQVVVSGGGIASPAAVWFGPGNYSANVTVTVTPPPASATAKSMGVSFFVFGSGSAGFAAPAAPASVIVYGDPYWSSSAEFVRAAMSSSGLGTVAPVVITEDSKSMPTLLLIIIIVLGSLLCIVLAVLLALCTRRSDESKKLKTMKSEVFQPIVAGEDSAGPKVAMATSPVAAPGATPPADATKQQSAAPGLTVATTGAASQPVAQQKSPQSPAQQTPLASPSQTQASPAPRPQYQQPQSSLRAQPGRGPAPALGNPSGALGNPKPAPFVPKAQPPAAQQQPQSPPAQQHQPQQAPLPFTALDVQPEGGNTDDQPVMGAGGNNQSAYSPAPAAQSGPTDTQNMEQFYNTPGPLLTEVPPHARGQQQQQGPRPMQGQQQRPPMQGGQPAPYRPQGPGQGPPGPYTRPGPGPQQQGRPASPMGGQGPPPQQGGMRPASPYGPGPQQGPPGQQRPMNPNNNMGPRPQQGGPMQQGGGPMQQQQRPPMQQGPPMQGPGPQGGHQQHASRGRPHQLPPMQQGQPGYRAASPQGRAASPPPQQRAASPQGRSMSPQGRPGPDPGPNPNAHYQYHPQQGGPSSPPRGGPPPQQGGFPVQRVLSNPGGGGPPSQPPVSRMQSGPRGAPPGALSPQARAASRANLLNSMISDVQGQQWAAGAPPPGQIVQQGPGPQQQQQGMRRPGPGPQQQQR